MTEDVACFEAADNKSGDVGVEGSTSRPEIIIGARSCGEPVPRAASSGDFESAPGAWILAVSSMDFSRSRSRSIQTSPATTSAKIEPAKLRRGQETRDHQPDRAPGDPGSGP